MYTQYSAVHIAGQIWLRLKLNLQSWNNSRAKKTTRRLSQCWLLTFKEDCSNSLLNRPWQIFHRHCRLVKYLSELFIESAGADYFVHKSWIKNCKELQPEWSASLEKNAARTNRLKIAESCPLDRPIFLFARVCPFFVEGVASRWEVSIFFNKQGAWQKLTKFCSTGIKKIWTWFLLRKLEKN
jgi:hypothetical protein